MGISIEGLCIEGFWNEGGVARYAMGREINDRSVVSLLSIG